MDATEKDPSIITDSPKIPGYTILSRLGEGGMATVYLAIQESFGRKVALKVMMPKAQADKSFGERFTREAKIVARLSHPHIVPVYDVGVAGDYHYISMEYLNSGDLAAKIKRGNLPVEEVIRITSDVAQALDYAHRKGIIHRDVKPDNIMFREDGAAVLTDFGIARPAAPDSNMTQVGKVIGTPKYMSPEQTKGEELNGTCDIYALGVMFYEMLTGQVPYPGKDPFEIGMKHLKDPVPQLPSSVSIFQPLLEGLMAKNRMKRIQTGQEVVAALNEITLRTVSKNGKKAAKPAKKPLPDNDKTVIQDVTSTMRADINDRNGKRYSEPEKRSPIGIAALLLAIVLGGGLAAVWFAPGFAANTPLMSAHTVLISLIKGNPEVQKSAEHAAPVAQEEAAKPAEALSAETQANETLTAGTGGAGEPALDPVQEKLRISLEKAKIAIALGNYVTPFGESALDHYRAAAALDTDNMDAKLGIVEIANKLVAQANESVQAKDFDKTRELIMQAKSISENIPGLISVEAAVREYDQKLLARQQAELDKARNQATNASAKNAADAAAEKRKAEAAEAKRLANAAEKQLAEEKRKLALEEERLRQEEINMQQAQAEKANSFQTKLQVKGLVAKGDTYFSRMEYYAPAGENALDKYAEALAIDPANTQAKTGINKVIAIAIPQIHTLLENLQEEQAKALYKKALAASPSHSELLSLGKSKGW